MSPLLNVVQARVRLAVLAACLLGALSFLAMNQDVFYIVYPENIFVLMHTIMEFTGIVVGISVFLVVWYSWPQTHNSRDLLIGVVFLAVGIIDLAHTLSYKGMPDFFTGNDENKAAIFWITGRLLLSTGLLAAVFVKRRTKYSWVQRGNITLAMFAAAVIFVIIVLYYPEAVPCMYVAGVGQTALKIGLERLVLVLNGVALFFYGRRNPSQRHVFFLRTALVFNMVSELAFLRYTNAYDIFNLLGHLYKIGGYYFILRALLETSILHPYIRISRLASALRGLAVRNIKLYKETRESHNLLKQTFIQLGATIASKHNLEQMLQQVVQSATVVYQSEHAYLALAEGNLRDLRIVAYVSSFKPPEKLQSGNCFMGSVFTNGQTRVIDNFDESPERVVCAFYKAGLRSMVGAPIRHNGDVIGVLAIFSKKQAAFSDDDADFLTVFARHAGEAIKNARFYENTVQSFNELKLLYNIVKDIANQVSPGGLLKQVSDKLHGLFYADSTLAFIMHQRDDGVHAETVFNENFSGKETAYLERMFSDNKITWPWACLGNTEIPELAGQQGLITLSILSQKRLSILPLLTGNTLQGLIIFGWNDPKMEIPSGLEMMLGTIAGQTAIGLERACLYENVQTLALTDGLTKLPNRRQFDASLMREFSRSAIYGRPVSLVMVDIDFFKKVNDTWGHLAGDNILQQLGSLIKKVFRNTDFPARYGGEEFVVILPETDEQQAVELAENFRRQVAEQPFIVDEKCISITVSLGIAVFGGTWRAAVDNKTQLVEAADQALYQAKQTGRNKVVVWGK